MEEEWMKELQRRLQKEETYQLWAKGAQNIRAYLEEHLTEDHRDLLLDYAAALSTMETYRVYHAYELGVEHGRSHTDT